MSAWDAEAFFAVFREAYERGKKNVVLETVRIAIELRQPIPEWAAKAFVAAYDQVMETGASWDDVFGRPHPKGKHRHTFRLESRKYEIYDLVQKLHKIEGKPIGNDLFSHVGRKTGIGGATIVRDLYYRVQRVMQFVAQERIKTDGN